MADDIQKKYLKILLIKSTYKTLLGRPADPDGLKNYYHAISDKSLAESAQLLNASLMNSDEFKGLTPSRMAFENVCIPPHPVSGTENQGRWAVKHTTNFYLLAFSLRNPSHLQLESIASGENYSLYRFTPESEERFTGKFPSLTDEMVFISKVLSFNLEL